MFNVRNVSLGLKSYFYKKKAILAVKYGEDTWARRMNERHNPDVLEITCFLNVCATNKMNRWRNEKLNRRVCVHNRAFRHRTSCCEKFCRETFRRETFHCTDSSPYRYFVVRTFRRKDISPCGHIYVTSRNKNSSP